MSDKPSPKKGRSLYTLIGVLVVMGIVYYSLPKSWFEIPEETKKPSPTLDIPAMIQQTADSRDFKDHLHAGMQLAKEGKMGEAEERMKTALRLAPEAPVVHHNIGVFYLNTNQPDKADIAFQRELEISPGYGPAHYSRGLTLQARRRYAEAALQMELATQLSPDFADPYVSLATQLTGKRPVETIQKWIDNYLRLGGANKGMAYYDVSVAYKTKKDYPPAIKYGELALKEDENSYLFLRNMGQLYSYTDKTQEADALLRKALPLTKDPSPVYIEIGMNAQKRNKLDDAVAAMKKSLELSPQTGNVHLYLSRIYQRQGNKELAAKEDLAFREWQKREIVELNKRHEALNSTHKP